MRPIIIGLVIALASAVAMVAGCGGGSCGGGNTLSGTVVDAGSLQPIAGAQAIVGGKAATTDANGLFVLECMGSGAVTVTVIDTNYVNSVVEVPAGSGDRSAGIVYLAPAPLPNTGNVTGIISQGGLAAAGAVITCAGHTSRSRSDGTYTLYNVLPGFQTITVVNAAGTLGGSKSVTVESGNTITANIPLTSTPPTPPSG